MDSAELVILGREVVRQVAEEVEVGRAVAVVGGRRRRRGGVHRLAVEIPIIAVGLIVTVSLASTSGWCDDRRGGSCDRRRGCRHAGRRKWIGRRYVTVRDAGSLAALMNMQLTGGLLVICARVTLIPRPVVAGTWMHWRLMSDIALGDVLLRVLLLLLLAVVEIMLPGLRGHGGVPVCRQILARPVIIAAGRITVISRRHVTISALFVLSRRVSLAGVVRIGTLHTSVISVIRWPGLRISVILSGTTVLQLLLMELHVGTVHRS